MYSPCCYWVCIGHILDLSQTHLHHWNFPLTSASWGSSDVRPPGGTHALAAWYLRHARSVGNNSSKNSIGRRFVSYFQDPQSSTTLLEKHSWGVMFTSGICSSWALHPWRKNRWRTRGVNLSFQLMWSVYPLQVSSFFLYTSGVHFPTWAESTCHMHFG